MKASHYAVVLSFLTIAPACTTATTDSRDDGAKTASAPTTYRADAFWPKPFRGNLILGQVAWVAVDGRNHVWSIHRSGTILDEEKARCRIRLQARDFRERIFHRAADACERIGV
jgi:hypothetical protein